MPVVYVHIGMPKTGTTYLQKFLEQNETLLNREGYTFPIFGTPFEKIAKGRNGYFLKFKADKESNIYPEYLEKIKNISKDFENIILSNESHWNEKSIPWNEIKTDFSNIGLTMKLVIYLRRQDAFAQSLWAQKVKTGYLKTFEDFVNSALFNNYYLDYHKRLKELSEAIGRENIIVRTYDKIRFQHLDTSITADFLEAVGLKETEEYIPIENTNMNPSLSGPYLEVKRILNQDSVFKTRQNFASKLLTNIIEEEKDYVDFNSNQFLSRRTQKKLLKNYKQSNELVAKEYLLKKDGILFEEKPSKQKFDKNMKYSAEELVSICGKMLKQQQAIIEDLKKKLYESNL